MAAVAGYRAIALLKQLFECWQVFRGRTPGATLAVQWAFGEQFGIGERIAGAVGWQLHLLIEKDFQGLHKRAGEDESDYFRNPAAWGNARSVHNFGRRCA